MYQQANQALDKRQRVTVVGLQIVAIAMAVYHLIYTQRLFQDPEAHVITHLGFALVVVFLSLMLASSRGWYLKLVSVLAAVGATLYLLFSLEEILTYRSSVPNISDLIIGVLVILLVTAGTYLVYGKTFVVIAGVFVAYLYLGRYLPYPFVVAAVPIRHLIMWLSAGVGTAEGVYGMITAISANYLFLFVFFGAVLHALGGTRFIIEAGRWIGSKLQSGPAAVAVFGSSMVGMCTGTTVANIAITGSFTIPLMKKAGYSPAQAGAIEAAASNGGQIMPPIMGDTAFLLAGFIGIAYVQVVIAATLPALLYFFGVFMYVQLTAAKMKVTATMETVRRRQLLLDAPIFFLPLGVLVFLMAQGYSLPFVAFWSVVTLVATALISSVRKEARLSFGEVVERITRGIIVGSQLAIVCALVNIVATCIKVSGLGIKLPMLIYDASHGILIIGLLITMMASVVLGMGVPSTIAYILVSIAAVPALVNMGVPVLQAHLFCFVFGVFSHLTPPVAMGALVASQLANGKYWPTAWESCKAGFMFFLLPYFIVYAPAIILRPDVSPMVAIAQILAMPLGVASLQIFIHNYCRTDLRLDERITFLIAALLCFTTVFAQDYVFLLAGASLFMVSIARQQMRKAAQRRSGGE